MTWGAEKGNNKEGDLAAKGTLLIEGEPTKTEKRDKEGVEEPWTISRNCGKKKGPEPAPVELAGIKRKRKTKY